MGVKENAYDRVCKNIEDMVAIKKGEKIKRHNRHADGFDA